MTSFTNDDLYQMLLDRLRKDRKGGVNPEEFESFLRWRNLDYYNKMLSEEGMNKGNEEALRPFIISFYPLTISQDSNSTLYFADLSTLPAPAPFGQYINVWHTTNIGNPTRPILTSLTEVDVVSQVELPSRLSNAITGPSASYPIGHFAYDYAGTKQRLYVHGISSTTGHIVMSYYKLPADPYFDYYIDANGNYTYLTDGQSAYTLQSGEVARDGKVAGQQVTSASQDLEWGDEDAVNILDMIVSDVSIALSDPNSLQASYLERKDNA